MIIGRRILGRGHETGRLLTTTATESPTTVNLYAGNWPESFVALNNLHDNPGATKERRRVGRGEGSGRGKTSGRGQKGQNARSGSKPRLLFAGGQTPLSRAVPKKGFHNPNRVIWTPLNLDHLSRCIDSGKLKTDEIMTMKTLRDSGVVGKKIRHGVKILATGADEFPHCVHLQVSKCSIKAEDAIERNGGTVRLVYYDKTGLRALLKPESYLRKGWMIPEMPRYLPPKRADAYDFIGEAKPKREITDNEAHFKVPKRKQEGHPKLPPGRGHIKNRYKSRIVVDYGRRARAQQEKQSSE